MVNRANYHLARRYLDHLRVLVQLTEQSLGRYWSYLRHLLLWADEMLFGEAPARRPTFPAYLASRTPSLAPATVKKILQTAKRFFLWAKQASPRDFHGVAENWINTLRAPRQAQAVPEHAFVTVEEAVQLATSPVDPDDLAARRDRAGVALLFLSGMRAGALGSLPIQAVDIPSRTIKQWPSLGVHTKNLKSDTT